MNPQFAIGQKFHFEVDIDEIGYLFLDGTIVSNNGDIAIVQISSMNDELFSLLFTRRELEEIIGDFDDQYVNKEFPFEQYAIIDAETGDFRFQHNPETDEIEEI